MKKIKVNILDYGFGNIKSLSNCLKFLNFEVSFYSKNKNNFDILIIPGIGSYNNAMKKLGKINLIKTIKKLKKEKKIIGICLGMQIMLDVGYENQKTKGLGLIKGQVSKIKFEKKLPLVGYFPVKFLKNKLISLTNFNMNKFYHVHSFEAKSVSVKNVLAYIYYNNYKYISAVYSDNLIGFQFHPEKSGIIGIRLLKSIINQLMHKNENQIK